MPPPAPLPPKPWYTLAFHAFASAEYMGRVGFASVMNEDARNVASLITTYQPER